jgi:hypothetical protein
MLSLALVAVPPADATGSPARAHEVSFADGFDPPAIGSWEAGAHALGRGRGRAEHVALGGGAASLTLPAGSFDGAEIRSLDLRADAPRAADPPRSFLTPRQSPRDPAS